MQLASLYFLFGVREKREFVYAKFSLEIGRHEIPKKINQIIFH